MTPQEEALKALDEVIYVRNGSIFKPDQIAYLDNGGPVLVKNSTLLKFTSYTLTSKHTALLDLAREMAEALEEWKKDGTMFYCDGKAIEALAKYHAFMGDKG